MSTMEISNLTKEKLKKMFLDGKRFDSRDLLEFRNIKVVVFAFINNYSGFL